MPIHDFKTSSYARNIYLYGAQKFAEIPVAYVDQVMIYAVETFTQEQIDQASAKAWINEDEYSQTLASKVG
jgi:hypothetical protein